MGKVEKASSENAAAFLWRYKMALYRSMEEMELPNHRWLAEEIERGACVFGDVTIDAGARPPITQDRKHPDFFRAVVLLDDTAMPGLVDLGRWRNFVPTTALCPRGDSPSPAFRPRPAQHGLEL